MIMICSCLERKNAFDIYFIPNTLNACPVQSYKMAKLQIGFSARAPCTIESPGPVRVIVIKIIVNSNLSLPNQFRNA